MHSYRVADGHGLPRDPVKAIIAPRPIGWISTLAADGTRNLAPYSFFNQLADKPAIIGFSSVGRKDSMRNAEATGEFVFNLATRSLAEQMNVSSAPFGPEVDEFAAAGLVAAPSLLVAPPRVAASPAALECKVTDILPIRALGGVDLDTWLVLGEVVAVHIDPAFIVDGQFNTGAAQPIMRAGYAADYFGIDATGHFAMHRPQV